MASKPDLVIAYVLYAVSQGHAIALPRDQGFELLNYINELETENKILKLNNDYLQDDFEAAMIMAAHKK